MVERLLKPFYEVMYKYEKHFSELGVKYNLAIWEKNKSYLLELLSCHPNWNEEALAVVFNITERREIDHVVVDGHRNRLYNLARDIRIAPERQQEFEQSLADATDEYSSTLSELRAEAIKERSDIKCVAGQKASRVINRICQRYGISDHIQYNAVFAQIADALNPNEVRKTALLSIHPCDYLEMSNKDNSWTSCHNLRNGGWQAGCLSYMGDETSMIFYTVDETVTGEYYKASRRNRQVFCYEDGKLLQSRLYPNDNDNDAKTLYRSLVQGVIADCMSSPNRWTLKRKLNDYGNKLHTEDGSRQYLDYSYYGTLSLLKSADTAGQIHIGGRAYCVCCGRPLTSNSSIKCRCDSKVVCQECGKTVSADNARFHEGAWLCHSCLHVCAHCGLAISDDAMFPVFNANSEIVQVCRSCHEAILEPCAACSMRNLCQSVSGNRLCQRTVAAMRSAA